MDIGSLALGALAGVAVGGLIVGMMMRSRRGRIEEEARREAEQTKQRLIEEGKATAARLKADESENILKRRKELEKELKDGLDEQRAAEKRLEKREDLLDRKLSDLERKEEKLQRRDQDLQELELKKQEQLKSIEVRKKDLEAMIDDERRKLTAIAGLTPEMAKGILLERVEADIAGEIAEMTMRAVNRAKEHADGEARKVLIQVIQKIASDFVAENTVSTIDLPNDDMKGRIIGREGRNIRAFEKATGVDVIVDDTPGVVVLSCFEPVRREIARVAMEKLTADGRIHPTRIEESVQKAEQEVTALIEKTGKEVAVEFNCHDLKPRLCNLLGRLRFRTSYGQNILGHVREVAHICGLLAQELRLDVQLARRCGLLHDIGKALDQEMEGTHPQIGMEIAKQCDERIEVVESAGGHHGDIELHSLYPILVQIADAISAARPGARRESLEKYIQRMKRLEEIATQRKGVEKAFAIQAGREIRVLAKAEELNDADCQLVARDIAKQIEDELNYPGEVRVTLIREARFIEYAR
jgi:ribonucrease Y